MTPEQIISAAKQVLEIETKGMNLLKDSIGDSFVQAVNLMFNTKGRVIISGMGKSGHVGQKMAATLASTGTPSFFVHPSEASHGDLGMLTKSDTLITISNSGESREMGDIISFSRRFGIPMIAITGCPTSSMAQAADIVLLIPNKKDAPEACPLGMAPTTSTTTTIALGDALAVALLEMRGFTREQFHDRHPGGKLGNVLLKVSDVMAKGDEMPIVSPTMMMADALVIMTEKSLGCLGIVNENGVLIGVITDGDLRRHMTADIIVRQAQDIMTKNPKTIPPNMLGTEAVGLMNSAKITNVFVVDADGKPLGLLHLHHLLQAGVV
ncbi:MAG: KpsF/GutQ family sugar-phosphate isomerase [Alphaproteobacteria bacterium]|nr:KpsF/GutQ family sugar-phosphate isomerase [Alphaproteobacteria bacterium]